MNVDPRSIGTEALRLMAAILLLGCPNAGAAAGTWSVISLPQKPGEVAGPRALATDAAGNLYIADTSDGVGRVQKRDMRGNWSVIVTETVDPGQTPSPGQTPAPAALAVDATGSLYVAETSYLHDRIRKRDPQGNWSVIAPFGFDLGQVRYPTAMAVDAAGSLYIADQRPGSGATGPDDRILKRDPQGNWSVIATYGTGMGQITAPFALAVDAAGNLFIGEVAEPSNEGRLLERDAQGNWSVIAFSGADIGEVSFPAALAMDAAGSLYIADANNGRIEKRDSAGSWSVIDGGALQGIGALATDGAGSLYLADTLNGGRIQRRDAQGNWSMIASHGSAPGQILGSPALAADGAGSLYVADGAGGGRVQKRDARGSWSILAGAGDAPGQVRYPRDLTADTAGNLYVLDDRNGARIQKRDAQGNWTEIATTASGQLSSPRGLAADGAGNLYVTDIGRLLKRDARGNWSVIAMGGFDVGQVAAASAMAVDDMGSLYVADLGPTDSGYGRIQRRDAAGSWSVVAKAGLATGQIASASALAADAAGDLFVLDFLALPTGPVARLQRRDAQGSWSVVPTDDPAVGPVNGLAGLAVDPAGHIYVGDAGNNRLLEYMASGSP